MYFKVKTFLYTILWNTNAFNIAFLGYVSPHEMNTWTIKLPEEILKIDKTGLFDILRELRCGHISRI